MRACSARISQVPCFPIFGVAKTRFKADTAATVQTYSALQLTLSGFCLQSGLRVEESTPLRPGDILEETMDNALQLRGHNEKRIQPVEPFAVKDIDVVPCADKVNQPNWCPWPKRVLHSLAATFTLSIAQIKRTCD